MINKVYPVARFFFFLSLCFSFLGLSAAMENYKIIDLTHTVHPAIPTWDLTCGYGVITMRDYQDCPGEFKFRSQTLDIRASAGTHIDSPSHCFEGAREVADIPVEQLLCPCVVINVVDKADATYKVSVEDIKDFEKKHGTIKPGTFVLVMTGWSRFWNNPEKYQNQYKFPTVSQEAAEFLIKREIAGLGIDTLSPDCGADGTYHVHKIILGSDKFIVENIANPQEMPEVGAYILIMPLNIQGAAESPVRLVGLLP